MFVIDRKRKARQRWEKLLNQGHRFALVDGDDIVQRSARYESELAVMLRMRKNLRQVNIQQELDKMPQPDGALG